MKFFSRRYIRKLDQAWRGKRFPLYITHGTLQVTILRVRTNLFQNKIIVYYNEREDWETITRLFEYASDRWFFGDLWKNPILHMITEKMNKYHNIAFQSFSFRHEKRKNEIVSTELCSKAE